MDEMDSSDKKNGQRSRSWTKDLYLFLGCLFLGAVLMILFLILVFNQNSQDLVNPVPIQAIETLNFSPSLAPSLALKAQIATVSGKVLWQSRIATQPGVLT